ncbi:MAG TPA: 30S ribosomal protein THX [Xanthomonadaceae bacterium]|nr:30S ribosomal protein THX [Xanthomonadaceae bacterium]
MGKGDRKTAKGKRFSGSHGNVRVRKPIAKKPVTITRSAIKPLAKTAAAPAARKAHAAPAAKKAPAAPAAKKAPAKKAPAKKKAS